MRKRILLVDDDMKFRGLVAQLLKELPGNDGLVVEEADSAIDALKMAHGKQTIIISDLNMAGMRGDDLLKTLRAQSVETPFILWSSYMTSEVRSKVAGIRNAFVFSKNENERNA